MTSKFSENSLFRRLSSLLLFAGLTIAIPSLPGGELADRKAVFAHYTAWHTPGNASFNALKYYNFPLFRPTGNSRQDLRNEILLAQSQGIDGFFVDIVHKPGNIPTNYVSSLLALLDAAEGLDFHIGPCLDVRTTVTKQTAELTKLLKAAAHHPNYPHVDGRPVVATYTCINNGKSRWSADEFRQIRQGVRDSGFNPYLIGHFRFDFQPIDLKLLESYNGIFDMAYSFAEAGLNGTPSGRNIRILRNFTLANGMRWMASLWPGYYGAWLNGRNDFYQPFLGFDQLHENFLALDRSKDSWLHLTTWNDHDESSLCPMLFTPANPRIVKAYTDFFKGRAPSVTEPEIMFAYYRELLPGTLLRIEVLSLPTRHTESAEISGALLDLSGRQVASLPIRRLKTGDFDRAEWLIPTLDLAESPILIPEISVRSGNYAQTRRLPPLLFKSGWLQNQVTQKVAFRDQISFRHSRLDISRNDGVTQVSFEFDSEFEFDSVILWKNDRPVAAIDPDISGKKLLNLLIVPDRRNFTLTVHNGKIRRALRRSTGNEHPDFKVSETQVVSRKNSPGKPISITLEADTDTAFTLAGGGRNRRFTLKQLMQHGPLHFAGVEVTRSPVATALYNGPAASIAAGSFKFGLWEEISPGDMYYVTATRTGTSEARTFPLFPHTPGTPVPTALLATAVTPDTSSQRSGRPGRIDTDLAGRPIELPPSVRTINLHPGSIRMSRWTFSRRGTDSWGEMPLNIPEKLLGKGGIGNGNCLLFDGSTPLRMPCRVWPINSMTLDFQLKPDTAQQGNAADLFVRSGWSSACNVRLLADGRLSVERDNGGKTPSAVLKSSRPIPVSQWTRVRITFDEQELKLYLNNLPDGSSRIQPQRTYGNCTTFIGKDFHGRLDDIAILGSAVPPGDPIFP